jgi:hypothetical protein
LTPTPKPKSKHDQKLLSAVSANTTNLHGLRGFVIKISALNFRKDAIGKGSGTIRKGILLDPHAIEDTQKES